MRKLIKKQDGMVVVEATIIMPIVILCTIALYYAAIFLCQKANLQTSLEVAAVYYKNTLTDTYVDTQEIDYIYDESGFYSASGSVQEKIYRLNPYADLLQKFDEERFKEIFYSNCKFMFFDSGEDISFAAVKDTNYLVYREITVTAKQTLTPAISFKFIGIENNEVTITSSVKLVVNNTDEFIRNIDFGMDIIDEITEGSEAREKFNNMVGQVVEFYNKYCK